MVGLDGAVGIPGYSGLLPSPMLASSLITGREAVVAGDATHWLYAHPQTLHPPMPWRLGDEADTAGPKVPKRQVNPLPDASVRRLQPNVRAVLAEMELLQSLVFKAETDNAHLLLTGTKKTEVLKVNRLHDEVFRQQLKLVASYASLRAERSAEILSQVVPQTAHWSAIAALSGEQRYTWEVIGIGLRFSMMMVMRFKQHFNVLRPHRLSAVIQPMILTPGYTAYPCGHATEASFVAELLPLLARDPTYPRTKGRRTDGMARQLNRLASRIAENRVIAGLHFPVDSIAGQALGVMLARYFVWLAGEAHLIAPAELTVGAVVFPEPGNIQGTEEPDFDAFLDESQYVDTAATELPVGQPADAPILRGLWSLAQREWT